MSEVNTKTQGKIQPLAAAQTQPQSTPQVAKDLESAVTPATASPPLPLWRVSIVEGQTPAATLRAASYDAAKYGYMRHFKVIDAGQKWVIDCVEGSPATGKKERPKLVVNTIEDGAAIAPKGAGVSQKLVEETVDI